ncbi:hypothetical protein GC176_27165 [bacterium]|nr:hypothetical protein [bacterium]
MARRSKPWYWKARQSWFVTIDGTRHNLGPDKQRAWDRFHELMRQPENDRVASESVVALIDRFLDWTQKKRAPDTFEWYRYRLQRFAERYPDLQVSELRPFHDLPAASVSLRAACPAKWRPAGPVPSCRLAAAPAVGEALADSVCVLLALPVRASRDFSSQNTLAEPVAHCLNSRLAGSLFDRVAASYSLPSSVSSRVRRQRIDSRAEQHSARHLREDAQDAAHSCHGGRKRDAVLAGQP